MNGPKIEKIILEIFLEKFNPIILKIKISEKKNKNCNKYLILFI